MPISRRRKFPKNIKTGIHVEGRETMAFHNGKELGTYILIFPGEILEQNAEERVQVQRISARGVSVDSVAHILDATVRQLQRGLKIGEL